MSTETSSAGRVWLIQPDEGDSYALHGDYDDLRWLALAQHLVARAFHVILLRGESIPLGQEPVAVVLNGLNRTAPQAARVIRKVRSLLPDVPIYVTGRAAVEVARSQPSVLAVKAASEDTLAAGLAPDGSLSSASTDRSWWCGTTPDRHPDARTPLGVLDVEATRGCTHACTFCSVDMGSGGRHREWTPRPPRDVAEEIRRWTDAAGTLQVQFVDDSFLGSPHASVDWACELARELRARVPGLRFSIFARLDPTLLCCLDDLCSAGLVQVHGGVESASPRMLRLMRKGVSRGTLDRVFDAVVGRGVEVVPSFIVFDPRALPADILETLAWIQERQLEAWFTPTTAMLYAGTKLRQELEGSETPGSVFLGPDGCLKGHPVSYTSKSVEQALSVAREFDLREGAQLAPPLDDLMRVRMRRDADLSCTPVAADPRLSLLAAHRSRQMTLIASELGV